MKNIHALAYEGHDGVKIESHSLPFIGVAAGLLIAFSSTIAKLIVPEGNTSTAYVELIFGALFLAVTFFTDFLITKAKRKKRNESTSLIHKKVVQTLLAMIGIAMVLSIYMLINFGPGKLALWYLILVFGLILFVVGQFSVAWYTTNGIIIIGFSIVALLFIPPDITLRLMTASLFIWGGIFIQILKPLAKTPFEQVIFSIVWVVIVIISSVVSRYIYNAAVVPGDLPEISLNKFQEAGNVGRFALNLPKDTSIRIVAKLEIDAFSQPFVSSFDNSLSREIDIEIKNQQPTGRFRIDGGKWLAMDDGPFIRNYLRTHTLSPITGPQVNRHHTLKINSAVLD
ncbi:hypothetical protein [Kaarinaea lacus]